MGIPNPSVCVQETCEFISKAMGIRTLLLVLDDVGVLGDPDFRHLIGYHPEDFQEDKLTSWNCLDPRRFHNEYDAAMRTLQSCLNVIWGSRAKIVCYCNGHVPWRFMTACDFDYDKLMCRPVVLMPLEARDVLKLMRQVRSFRGSDDPSVQAYLAEVIAKRSGGQARVVVRALEALSNETLATSIGDADGVLQSVEDTLMRNASDVFLRATDDTSELCDPALLRTVGRYVLHNVPFKKGERVELKMASGTISVLVSAALSAAGFNFAPHADGHNRFVAVAGEWQLAALLRVLGTAELEQALQQRKEKKN